MSALLPEKPLVISTALATTLGLEEAVLLSTLQECLLHRPTRQDNGLRWLTLTEDDLRTLLPFWDARDLQRIAKSLADKGVLECDTAPFLQTRQLTVALSEHGTPARRMQPPPQRRAGQANLLARQWQPDPDVLAQLALNGVPEAFALSQVGGFTLYWGERQEAYHAWSARFVKHVMREWRRHQSEQAGQQGAHPLPEDWQPSLDALEILDRAGIPRAFSEDAIPEFVLYWAERGEHSKTWNSRFLQHVKRQWARFTSTLEHDTEPRRLPPHWRPSPDVQDILHMANIDPAFAEQLLPEFVLFWRDSNQLHSSWNTKFLQHVKYQWARQHHYPLKEASTHGEGRTTGQSGDRKSSDILERLTDRSWAEGLR